MATGTTVLLGLASTGAGAVAAVVPAANVNGDVKTVVRKSQSITANPDGQVTSSVLVTQLQAVGKGTTNVKVPIGTSSLRNLDGFTTPPTQGDDAVFDLSVDGVNEQRIYTKANHGPITVKATVLLDGKPIPAGDVVNKTGVLDVRYKVTNTTARTINGLPVADPIGGSVTIITPPGFTELTAKGASIGGTGQGGNQLAYSLVLFPPLGEATSEVSYQSRIFNGTLPSAQFTFLPIVPYQNGSVQQAKTIYDALAKIGSGVTSGGIALGDNLIKLQDGASKLMAGLQLLQDGAEKLAAGINHEVIPGANKIATGAGTLSKALNDQIAPGATDLAAGINSTNPTTGLTGGANALNAGLAQLQAGINSMPASVQAQLKANADYTALINALTALINGGSIPTSLGPVTVPSETSVLATIAALGQAATNIVTATTVAGQQAGIAGANCGGNVTCLAAVAAIGVQLGAIGAELPKFAQLNPLSGLPPPTGTSTGTLGSWVVALTGTPGSAGFLDQLSAGLPTLINTLVSGIQTSLLGTATSPGLNDIIAGGTALAGGVAKVGAGATTLAEGIDTAGAGANTLADGAGTLADGLPQVGDGATKIAAGAGAAKTGAGQIAGGEGQLKTKGADALISSGEEISQQATPKLAALAEVQKLGEKGAGIPYGPAVGPQTTTTGVYQMTLNSPVTASSNNTVRYVLALIALFLAGGLGTVIWAHRSRPTNA